ncbi:MAG TPA: hypothetical protein VFZ00_12415 [Solirubrobacter sp.]|nr:hypothetical protein [Solirubrobacter sp.]
MSLRKPTLAVKALMITATVAATTMGLAAPAWAGRNVSAQIDFGALETSVYGAFHHRGDWVQLVDSCKDKQPAYIKVRAAVAFWPDPISTYYVAKKGQKHRCGSRWINRNFTEHRKIGIKVCVRIPASVDQCTPGWRWGIA